MARQIDTDKMIIFVSLGLLFVVAIFAIINMNSQESIPFGNAVSGQTRCVAISFGLGGYKVEVYRNGAWVFQETCYEGCKNGKCKTCTPKTQYKCSPDERVEQKYVTDAKCKLTLTYNYCTVRCLPSSGRCTLLPPPENCYDNDNGDFPNIASDCTSTSKTLPDTCFGVNNLKKIMEARCDSFKRCVYKEMTCSGTKKCYTNSKGLAFCG